MIYKTNLETFTMSNSIILNVCSDINNGILSNDFFNNYPHIESEYLKYIRRCKKNKKDLYGTFQFIPFDEWSLVMIDTMNSNNIQDIRYDDNYEYVVNIFINEYDTRDKYIYYIKNFINKMIAENYNDIKIIIPTRYMELSDSDKNYIYDLIHRDFDNVANEIIIMF